MSEEAAALHIRRARSSMDLATVIGLACGFLFIAGAILIGGAPTTQEWANEIGADGWGRDAIAAVHLAKKLIEEPREAWA